MSRFLPLVLFAAACSVAHADPDPCSATALGITNAQPLVAWSPPSGCVIEHPPAQAIVSSQSDLAGMFECRSGVGPQLDFSQNSLVVVTWQPSLAATGVDALDDGATVTLVEKARGACPNQAPPAATSRTSYFVIASSNARRNFGAASCTMQPNC